MEFIFRMFCLQLFTANLMKANDEDHFYTDNIGPIATTTEEKLHNNLFADDKNGKLKMILGKKLQVNFTMNLLSVVDVAITNEAIIINVNIIQKWYNPYTTWDPTMYDNITKVNVRPEKIWTPDIFAYANIEPDKKYSGLLSTFNTQVILNHDGHNRWMATTTMELSCGMNIKYYPFDTQVCPLRFGSYTYDMSRLELNAEPVGLDKYGESPEWHFISMERTTERKFYPGSKSSPYVDVIYTVVMKRKVYYPLMMIVAPNLILAFLTILVYMVPINAGERVMFIFTIFLAITFYLTSNIETMPNSSQSIPIITYFLGVSLFSMSILSICLCYTVTCYYADSKILTMPGWVRLYILEQFGRFLGISIDRKLSKWREHLQILRQVKIDKFGIEDDSNIGGILRQHQTKFRGDPNELASHIVHDARIAGDLCPSNDAKSQQLIDIFDKATLRKLHYKVEEILKALEDEDDMKWKQREWELVAETLDTIFLYVFSSALLLTIFACVIHILEGY